MNQELIIKNLKLVFALKGIVDEKEIIQKAWLYAFKEYNMQENEILIALKKYAITKTYGLQFSEFYELARPQLDLKAEASAQWELLRQKAAGKNYKGTKEAMQIFRTVWNMYDMSGCTSQYEKDSKRRRFIESYVNQMKKQTKEIQNENNLRIM